jgi:hemolysin activation/secretion protein
MNLWGVGFDIHRRDDMSNTSFIFNRLQSFGGSSDAAFVLARTGADSDFAIYTTSAYHSRFLDRSKVQRFSGSFRWITSDGRLVPAKMTSFGGLYSVRGYKEYEIVADGGIIASAQYEFDLVKYEESQEIGETESNEEMQADKRWLRKLAPLAFFDFGRAKIKNPVAGERAVHELYSVGLGTAVELGDNFSGAVYYGFPLRSTNDTSAGEGRFGFSFIYRF